MTIAIGRAGLNVSRGGDGFDIPDPFEVNQQGRDLTMSGYFRAASADEAVCIRDQLLGHDPQNNTDETAIPITFGDDNLDGFYEPLSVSASIPRGSLGTDGLLHVDWSGTFRRALDFKRPRIELTSTYALLTNDLSVTAGDLVFAVPNLGDIYTPGIGTVYQTTGAHGTVWFGLTTSTAPSGSTFVLTYSVPPEYYYYGCCKIEQSVSGTWRSVVGRRGFSNYQNIRISNGFVRAFISGSGTDIWVEWYDGSAWGTGSIYWLEQISAGLVTWLDAAVIKNSAEECVLRLYGLTTAGGQSFGRTVDLVVRRGVRILWLYCSTPSPTTDGWKMAHSSAVAYTSAPSYGMRRTSTLGGNYTVMMSNNAETRDLVNGSMRNATAGGGATTVFGVGASIGSGTSDVPSGASTVGRQFYVAMADSQRVVVG